MTMYLKTVFPEAMFTLPASSRWQQRCRRWTGSLVSISTITANDLVLNVIGKRHREQLSEEQQMALAMRVSHVVLIVIAVAAFSHKSAAAKIARHIRTGGGLWADGSDGGASFAWHRISPRFRITGLAGIDRGSCDSLRAVFPR